MCSVRTESQISGEMKLWLDLKEYEELRWSDLSQDTLNMNIENGELLSHIQTYKHLWVIASRLFSEDWW